MYMRGFSPRFAESADSQTLANQLSPHATRPTSTSKQQPDEPYLLPHQPYLLAHLPHLLAPTRRRRGGGWGGGAIGGQLQPRGGPVVCRGSMGGWFVSAAAAAA